MEQNFALDEKERVARMAHWMKHPYLLPLGLAALAMLLALPSLWTGLMVDDHAHRAVFTNPSGLAVMMEPFDMFAFVEGEPERTRLLKNLGFPWWTLDELRLAFWRPVTTLTHWLDYAVWPETPWLMHLHSLLWFGALIVAVTLMHRRFMGVGWPAVIATLIYAMDDAHAWPVFWIANRNALLSAVFGIATILLHDGWRRTGKVNLAALAPLCLTLGLLSNEGAVATGGYLFSYAVFIDKGRLRSRALSLIPYAFVVIVWRIFYQFQGYGAWGSQAYIDPVASPLKFAAAALARGPVLLLGQWAAPSSDAFMFVPATVQLVWWTCALVFLAAFAWVLIPMLRRDATDRFWCLGMLLALVPCCATFPADRLLLYPGIGGAALLARFLAEVRNGGLSFPAPSRRRRLSRALFYAFIVIHLIVAPIFFPLRICATAAVMHCLIPEQSIVANDAVTDKTVVVVDDPTVFASVYIPLLRALEGKTTPTRIYNLGAPTLFPVPVRLTRTDERTLVVEPGAPYQWILGRDDAHPFFAGDKTVLEFLSVEVLEVTDKGVPTVVEFRFNAPLEDESMIWLDYEGAHFFPPQPATFIPFRLPAVGESVVLNE